MIIKRPQATAVKKETLILSLQCLRHILLQTRNKLTISFKSFTHCCKLQTLFKNQRKLANVFQFKYHLPFDLVSGVAFKYTSYYILIKTFTGDNLKSVNRAHRILAVSSESFPHKPNDLFSILTFEKFQKNPYGGF